MVEDRRYQIRLIVQEFYEMRKTLNVIMIFCASACQFDNAESHDYKKYRNCSGEEDLFLSEMSNPKKIETSTVFNKNDYHFETILYNYKVKLGNKWISDSSCITVDQNRKVILDISKGSSTYCGGDWDKTLNHPAWKIWGDDSNEGQQEFIPSFILKRYIALKQKQPDSEIDRVYFNFKCMYQPYVKDDIEEINNTAFYFSQLGQLKKAIELLNEVVKLDHNRAVAYLNIADSYLALGKKDFAIQNYKKYIQLMQAKGLKTKIPLRVLECIK